MLLGEVLGRSQLKRLAEHKYSAGGTSLMEPCFQPFWCWLVARLPLWWAPNTLTLVGLVINVLTTVVLLAFSPDGRGSPPAWSFLQCALGLFIYQTLDAIDGKQARRTNSSSPLGELFDHGCDAVSIIFVILGTCVSLQLGSQPGLMLFECCCTMFLFYLAHWQAYCSGKLKFGLIDVTEAQLSIVLLYALSALFGVQFWSTELPWLGIELKMLPIGYSVFGALLACYSNLSAIFMKGGCGKNGSTVAGTSVLSPLLPIALVVLLATMIWVKSTTQIFRQHLVLYIVSFGMASAKVTTRLVVAHMSRTEMELLDWTLVGPAILFLNQYFNTALSERLLLCICCVYCSVDLLVYAVRLCRSIALYLNIHCFSTAPCPLLAPEPAPGGPSLASGGRRAPLGPDAARVSRLDVSGGSHSRSSSSSSCDTAGGALRVNQRHS